LNGAFGERTPHFWLAPSRGRGEDSRRAHRRAPLHHP